MLKLLCGALAAVFLSGCTVVSSVAANVDQAKFVVQMATMKVIEAGKDRKARAVKIREIAADAKILIDANAVSVDLVAQATRVRIAALRLAPSDQILADALLDSVVANLKDRVGDGVIEADRKLRVNTVLTWVIATADLY